MAASNLNMQSLAEQIQQLTAQLLTSEMRQAELERQMRIKNSDTQHYFEGEEDRAVSDADIVTNISSGDEIQLEAYRAIPVFDGKLNEYSPWRIQAWRRMKIIEKFMDHPKYEAALAIVRAKVTGPASLVLVNNKAKYNITSIIRTLDVAYSDRRPLYAIEAEMTSIMQGDKTLDKFYNAINFALNAIISKVFMMYNTEAEQRPIINEATKKAIRTFTVGLRSRATRQVLYGQQPKTLSEAYAIAQTVLYDGEYLQLDQNAYQGKFQPRMNQQQGIRPMGFNKPQNGWNNNPWNQQRNNNQPQPMEVDSSNRVRSNWRQQTPPAYGQKRELGSTERRIEQPKKFQRINRLMDAAQPLPDNLISTDSDDSTNTNVSSAFLGE